MHEPCHIDHTLREQLHDRAISSLQLTPTQLQLTPTHSNSTPNSTPTLLIPNEPRENSRTPNAVLVQGTLARARQGAHSDRPDREARILKPRKERPWQKSIPCELLIRRRPSSVYASWIHLQLNSNSTPTYSTPTQTPTQLNNLANIQWEKEIVPKRK